MNQPALLCVFRHFQSRMRRIRRGMRQLIRKSSSEPERVHKLRVSVRKCQAILGLLKKYLPRKQRRWSKDKLKSILRITSPVRDLDVLESIQAVSIGKELKRLLQRRTKKARRSATRTLTQLGPKKFDRRSRELIRKLRKTLADAEPVELQPNEFWTDEVRRAVERFSTAATGKISDQRELHQLRIASKKLRYLLDALAKSGITNPSIAVPQELVEIQLALGSIHDHQCAADFLQRMALSSQDPAIQVQMNAAHAHHLQLASDAIQSMQTWWTDEFVARVKQKCNHTAQFLQHLATLPTILTQH